MKHDTWTSGKDRTDMITVFASNAVVQDDTATHGMSTKDKLGLAFNLIQIPLEEEIQVVKDLELIGDTSCLLWGSPTGPTLIKEEDLISLHNEFIKDHNIEIGVLREPMHKHYTPFQLNIFWNWLFESVLELRSQYWFRFRGLLTQNVVWNSAPS
jgi:hypothetical protein